MDWELTKWRKERLQKEKSFVAFFHHGASVRVALVYPNTYYVGMSSLGFQVVYDVLNCHKYTSAERFFYPDHISKGLYSLETGTPLGNYDIIGFSVSFELDYIRVPQMLSFGNIPYYCSQRENPFPLVIGGGAFSFYNPEPLADFFDAIVLGEAEEILAGLVDVVHNFKLSGNKDKGQLLKDISNIDGIYVPALHANFSCVKKYYLRDLNHFRGASSVITPDTEFKNMFLLEIARGCKHSCSFCMVGKCIKPYRTRNLDFLKETLRNAKSLTDSIGLIAPNVSDYKDIDELCSSIISLGMKISFSSLRADTITGQMISSLVTSGQKTITLAPEAGQRLRQFCRKFISDDDFLRAVEISLKEGIKNFKCYFMIGLPGETDADLEEIVCFVRKIFDRGDVKLYLSINQFIPKPATDFASFPTVSMDEMEEKIRFLKDKFKKIKNVRLKFESVKWSFIQALLASGDRDMSRIIFLVSKSKKENFQSWRKALVD
ncbi:MAG: radical SAM protein [Candidatus Eremiobacterota bacterium]